MNILDYNHCNNKSCSKYPNCGWNIQLGGTSESELKALKKVLKDSIQQDFTKYEEKLNTESFLELDK